MTPLTAVELRKRYGRFYKRRRKVDASLLPSELRPLAPYAEVWGVGDDYEREKLVESAPDIARQDLVSLYADDALYRAARDWLGGDAADEVGQSESYQGLSCLYLAYASIKATSA